MGFKKWVVSSFDKELAKELSIECEVDPIVALIASARGYTDPYLLEQFISDEPYFTDPYEMADIKKAADTINASIENGEKIAIYGDYDCDGVCATTLLYRYLSSRKADCIYYIPDRFAEGYGMNEEAIKKLAFEKVNLIIPVVKGFLGFNEIKFAKDLGIKVVVTDHHIPKDALPDCEAVVNPHRIDCTSEFKDICGAEVAFRLICVLAEKEPEEIINEYADILAVAVIADVMPLTLENRSIVKCGIEKIKTEPNIGISALLSVSGVERDTITSSRIAFSLCPRINAAGRMGKANRAVKLLTSDNMMSAISLANEIDQENAKRQQIEKTIYKEAVSRIESEGLMYDRVIVVSGENWHGGVVGIVAARVSERYGVPAILLSVDGDTASGSGRSIEGFNLYEAISSASEKLIKFGGHVQAAGITIKTDEISSFREKINEYAENLGIIAPVLKLDCKLNPSALSVDLAFALSDLEPFGTGNPTPVFGVFAVTLQRITPIGNNKHLRLLFSKGENSFQALLFGVTLESFCFAVGDELDLAVTVEPNLFRGEYTVSVQIKSLRMTGTDDDKLFSELWCYNAFASGKEADFDKLLPERAEVGKIYKKISEQALTLDRLKYLFINEIGIAKTLIAVTVLQELELVSENNGILTSVKNAEKTDLLNSKTFKFLTERSGLNA